LGTSRRRKKGLRKVSESVAELKEMELKKEHLTILRRLRKREKRDETSKNSGKLINR
jgi:hypothetical protein